MTDYEWLTKMGLCHKCRREKMAPGKKFCFDCLDKIREENAIRYDSEAAKSYQARRREIYNEKKASGICARCSKRATHGLYCYEHSIEAKRRSKCRAERRKIERNDRGLVPELRAKEGLCLWCGKPAEPGISACAEHRKIFSEAGKKAKNTDEVVKGFWRLMESLKSSGDTC